MTDLFNPFKLWVKRPGKAHREATIDDVVQWARDRNGEIVEGKPSRWWSQPTNPLLPGKHYLIVPLDSDE